MIRYPTSWRNHTQLRGPGGSSLYPPVRRRPGRTDEPVPAPDVAKLKRTLEGRVQLGVYRYDPGLAALAPPNPDGGSVGVQRQIPRLDRERLGVPEPGPSFNKEQQPRPGVRGRSNQGVNFVSFQVLRELPGRLLLRVSPWLRVLAPGPAVALDGGGLLRSQICTPAAGMVAGQCLRVIVPFRGEVVQFKGRAQLRRPRQGGTRVPILLHDCPAMVEESPNPMATSVAADTLSPGRSVTPSMS